MSPSLHLLLVSLAALSWCTSPILAQNDSFWEADLTAACGSPLNDTDCIDRHMTTIFSNLTRLYNPEGAIYSNLSYLDHHLYKPHSTVHSLNDTLASILRTYPGNYSDAEMDILKAFPRRN
ncbi:hypothetical protein TYRP_004807 [Tyrophagus putrescentiae]|nr:hypothetical protein TYRP_004807 [Tyrophagus putrescentiae]